MPFAIRPPDKTPATADLKQAVRRLLDLDDGTGVVVQQLTCREPGCPPVETVVAVLPAGGTPYRWRVHRPTDQITVDDLRALLATTPEGPTDD